jgi:hypothetical protein
VTAQRPAAATINTLVGGEGPRQPAQEKGATTSFTASAYWKFESIPLQRRVARTSVRESDVQFGFALSPPMAARSTASRACYAISRLAVAPAASHTRVPAGRPFIAAVQSPAAALGADLATKAHPCTTAKRNLDNPLAIRPPRPTLIRHDRDRNHCAAGDHCLRQQLRGGIARCPPIPIMAPLARCHGGRAGLRLLIAEECELVHTWRKKVRLLNAPRCPETLMSTACL